MMLSSPNTPPTLAALLKLFRRASGLSQGELARRAGYSSDYISMIERGVRVPAPATIQALAKALDLDEARQQDLVSAQSRHGQAEAAGPEPSAGARDALFGRTDECQVIHGHLAGQGPQALFLAGEPGIGKTRLLEEASRLAPSFGRTVVAGACMHSVPPLPFSPLAEGLLRIIQERPRRHLRRALAGCEWLCRVLPELAAFGVMPPPRLLPSQQERRLVFGATALFLRNLAGPQGILLVLDDLQWVDDETLDLVAYLLRFSPVTRVIGAYRDTEVFPQHPLSLALAEGFRRRQMRQLELGPLSDSHARELFIHLTGETGGLSDSDVDLVVRRCEGVPRFLRSFADSYHSGALGRGRAGEIPGDLQRIVWQRVVSLPQPAQAILRLVAVANGRLSRHALYRAARLPQRTVLAAIETLAARGFLVEEKDGTYRFSRALVCDVIRQETGGARREALRRRLAAAQARRRN